jgi:hypothetical protein
MRRPASSSSEPLPLTPFRPPEKAGFGITGGEAGIPDLQAGRAQLLAGNYVSFILSKMIQREPGLINR